MNQIRLAAALAALVAAVPMAAHADDAPAGPSYSFNVGGVTDYRYRGISQSRLKPALQGGFDFSHPSGFYVGTWLSTIKWIKDAGTAAGKDAGSTPAEWDWYGGYKKELAKDLTLDVGGLYYLYVGNKLADIGAKNANTFEIYGALSYGPVTLKYSHALTNTFGFVDSKNSGYLDLSASFDVGMGITLAPHVGHQRITGDVNPYASYTDYSLTVSKDIVPGLTLSAMAVGTSTKDIPGGGYAYVSPDNKNLGKSAIVLGVKYTYSF